jgi:hypothetical protein
MWFVVFIIGACAYGSTWSVEDWAVFLVVALVVKIIFDD